LASFRQIKKEFTSAAWSSQTDQAEFVARALPLGDELTKLLPLLLVENNNDVDVRRRRIAAFVALSQAGVSPTWFQPLLKVGLKADDPLRRLLIPLLKHTHDKRYHLDICKVLKDSDAGRRRFAAALLKEIGGRTALEGLIDLLGEGGWNSRAEAIDVAAGLGGHYAIGALSKILERGSPEEKTTCLRILGDLRYVKASRATAARAIEPALYDDRHHIVLLAVKSFAGVALEEQFFDSLQAFFEHADRTIQHAALEALAQYPGARATNELQRLFRVGDPALRHAVLGVLQQMGDEAALPLLVQALSDSNLQVRNAALAAVVDMAKSRRVDVSRMVLWLLRSNSVDVRRQAVDIVHQVGAPLADIWPALLRLLRDEDWWVRERVVESLVAIAGTELTRHIVAYLQDEEDVVRRYAVEVLMRLKDPRSLGALVKTAGEDNDWWVRERAIEAVGLIGDPKTVPHLVKLAESDSTLIPVVINALHVIGDAKALPFFARVLQIDEPGIKLEALDAIRAIGDHSAARWVEPLAQDTDIKVRNAAREILMTWESAFEGEEGEAEVAKQLKGLEKMLWWMVRKGGDDLFLMADRPPRMKLMGEIVPLSEQALKAAQVEAIIRSMLTYQQMQKFEGLEDVDLSLEVKALKLRFRVNVLRQMTGWSAVFRRIADELFLLDELGLPPLVKQLADLPHGLVLIGGPTGSGKSTTLAAMIHYINKTYGKNVITIEDPIEIVHDNDKSLVTQREVGTHTTEFATALRATLREDPDVILVGEMRDLKTIQFAITAAETGHLVLATMHTVSADTSVDRLIDAFPPGQQPQVRTMLAQTLKAVICQQLLRRHDGEGRVVAAEVLLNTDAVSNAIRKGQCFQIPSIITTSRERGMQSMDDELVRLVELGSVGAEEAYVKAHDKKRLEPFLAAGGAPEAPPERSRPAPSPLVAGLQAAPGFDLEGPQPDRARPQTLAPRSAPGVPAPRSAPGIAVPRAPAGPRAIAPDRPAAAPRSPAPAGARPPAPRGNSGRPAVPERPRPAAPRGERPPPPPSAPRAAPPRPSGPSRPPMPPPRHAPPVGTNPPAPPGRPPRRGPHIATRPGEQAPGVAPPGRPPRRGPHVPLSSPGSAAPTPGMAPRPSAPGMPQRPAAPGMPPRPTAPPAGNYVAGPASVPGAYVAGPGSVPGGARPGGYAQGRGVPRAPDRLTNPASPTPRRPGHRAPAAKNPPELGPDGRPPWGED